MNICFYDYIPDHIRDFCDREFINFHQKAIDDSRNYFSFEALDHEICIGAARGYSYAHDLYIEEVIIISAERKKGVGLKILQDIDLLAKERECYKIWVDTLSYQSPEFYLKHGFQEINRIKNFRGDHDWIFFCKEI